MSLVRDSPTSKTERSDRHFDLDLLDYSRLGVNVWCNVNNKTGGGGLRFEKTYGTWIEMIDFRWLVYV